MEQRSYPTCDKCGKQVCAALGLKNEEKPNIEEAPPFCPMKLHADVIERAVLEYDKEDIRELARLGRGSEALDVASHKVDLEWIEGSSRGSTCSGGCRWSGDRIVCLLQMSHHFRVDCAYCTINKFPPFICQTCREVMLLIIVTESGCQ